MGTSSSTRTRLRKYPIGMGLAARSLIRRKGIYMPVGVGLAALSLTRRKGIYIQGLHMGAGISPAPMLRVGQGSTSNCSIQYCGGVKKVTTHNQ